MTNHPLVLTPKPLAHGDAVAIVSPASVIDPDLVAGACDTLTWWGFVPRVFPHALSSDGSYAGSADQRFDDLAMALTDPEIKGIICSRGGYGAVHLLNRLSQLNLAARPKWLVGFSDISALHGLMHSQGVMSIHGSMAKQLAMGPDDELNKDMLSLLTGHPPRPIAWQSADFVNSGTATAPMLGGNLAVITALIGTPFDLIQPGTILVVEDVAEPIYKVERMFYHLMLSGKLQHLAGLVVGQFTEYHPDRNHQTMEEMLRPLLEQLNCPVATNAPIGHIDSNRPWVEGATTTLTVTPDRQATITQHIQ